MTEEMTASDGNEERFIVYRVGADAFASPLLSIKEIVDPLPYCFVPNHHEYFLGLSNLRGQIIGVIDLGRRFGLHSTATQEAGVLLIFEEDGASLGALVSAVESAITVESKQISQEQAVTSHVPHEAYLGVVRYEDRILPIVSLVELVRQPLREPMSA